MNDLHWRQRRDLTDILYRVYGNRVEVLYHISENHHTPYKSYTVQLPLILISSLTMPFCHRLLQKMVVCSLNMEC